MALRKARQRMKGEPTIALINIVFLMLIFFMIAGALAPPLDDGVDLVATSRIDGRSPPDATVIAPDGSLSYRGQPTTPADIVARETEATGKDMPPVRLVPDRALPAQDLLSLSAALRDAGAGDIWLVTEKGLE